MCSCSVGNSDCYKNGTCICTDGRRNGRYVLLMGVGMSKCVYFRNVVMISWSTVEITP